NTTNISKEENVRIPQKDSKDVLNIKNMNKDDDILIEQKLDKEQQMKQKKMLEKLHYEALVLKKEGKLDQYEKVLIEGLAIAPNNKEFNQLLADLYFTMGNYNKALSLLKKIIQLDPQSHNAIRQIGEIYLITGDFETAELLIEKAISLKPSNPKYYISMVEVFYNTGRKKEAINIMEKVVRLRPTNTSYIFTLANLYEEL
ncbi:MAG: tetratricopeptide repeat protein, partial [bacterium]|nr:tetratricopeptide repeat protein [bacterium]